jgi:hypothetical protein
VDKRSSILFLLRSQKIRSENTPAPKKCYYINRHLAVDLSDSCTRRKSARAEHKIKRHKLTSSCGHLAAQKPLNKKWQRRHIHTSLDQSMGGPALTTPTTGLRFLLFYSLPRRAGMYGSFLVEGTRKRSSVNQWEVSSDDTNNWTSLLSTRPA